MSKFKEDISGMFEKITIRLWGVVFLTFVPILLFAQTGPPPCDPNGTEGDPYTDSCPLDTWVWLLVALAVLTVIYQSFRKKRALNSQA